MKQFMQSVRFEFFLVLVLASATLWNARSIYAGTLQCTVASACATGTVIFRMYNTTNSHAEAATSTNYANLACCWGVTNLSNACTVPFAKAIKLSSTTNAHAEQGTQTNYAYPACLSVPSGGSVSVAYQASGCSGYDTTIGSISSTTNAHVGDGNAYATKICATAAGPQSITLTLSSSAISFDVIPNGGFLEGIATTTVTVNVSGAVNGYNLSLYSNSSTSTVAYGAIGFPDYDPRWDPSGNGNAVILPGSTFIFRVGQGGTTSNYNATWWGADDSFGVAKYAGFATTSQQIMNCALCTDGSTDTFIEYRIGAPTSQQIGLYTGFITFTALTNP